MPGLNGRGPLGQGAMTGKGLGRCDGRQALGYGLGVGSAVAGVGYGLYRSRRRGFGGALVGMTESKEDLLQQKKILEDQIKNIDSRIEEN